MDKHPFDPVSLVFGVVFVAAGIILLAGGELTDEGRFLLPLGLIGLGVAVMVQAGNRAHARTRTEPVMPPEPEKETETLSEDLAGEYGAGDEVGAESGEDRQIEEPSRGHDG